MGTGGPRIDCVGGIVVAHGRLLLVQRGQEPARGTWSVPGGRVEAGESDADATAREVLEETGLHVEVGRLVGQVERDAPAGGVYVIRDYLCRLLAADPLAADPLVADPLVADPLVAGDDADDAGWFTAAEVAALDTAPGLVEALTDWGVLPDLDGSTAAGRDDAR